jgi:hypothetical protein
MTLDWGLPARVEQQVRSMARDQPLLRRVMHWWELDVSFSQRML